MAITYGWSPSSYFFLLLVHTQKAVITKKTAKMIASCPAVHAFDGHLVHLWSCL